MRQREQGFAELAFAPDEHELLGRLSADNLEEWQLRCWCAKEAVAKALGSGLSRGPRALTVTAIDPGTGRIEVRLGDEMARDHEDVAGVPLVVYSHRRDDLIVATTLCDRGGHDHDEA